MMDEKIKAALKQIHDILRAINEDVYLSVLFKISGNNMIYDVAHRWEYQKRRAGDDEIPF